jgi:hypothetical protein
LRLGGVGGGRDPPGERVQLRRLTFAAPPGRESRRLGQHQTPRLEQRGHRRPVHAAGGEQEMGGHVQPTVGAPVAHPHRVAVAHLHQAELLEALHGLAYRGHVHAEVSGEGPLGRQLLAGRVVPREYLGAEALEHLVGDQRALHGRGH